MLPLRTMKDACNSMLAWYLHTHDARTHTRAHTQLQAIHTQSECSANTRAKEAWMQAAAASKQQQQGAHGKPEAWPPSA